MPTKLLARWLLLLMIPALACTLSAPPTPGTPPAAAPTATAVSGPTTTEGFYVLNLTESDGEALNKRANDIYQNILDTGGAVTRTALIEAYAQLATYQHVGGQWASVGPAPIQGVYLPQGKIPGSGKVDDFAIDPRDPNVVYAAISIGGIWKTTDGGHSWKSLTEDQVPLIYGGIVMDPSNPDVLYAPLGEMDGFVTSQYGYLANGIMRSRDAGQTWQLIGQDTFLGAAVSRLIFGPNGKLYASSGQENVTFGPDNMPDFGIFSSDDGGDTWQRLAACSDFGRCDQQLNVQHASLSGGFFDLKLASDGTLFASHCVVSCLSTTLLRSKDDGQTWQKLDITGPLDEWQKANNATVAYFDDDQNYPRLKGYALAIAPTNPQLILAGGQIRYQDSQNQAAVTSWLLRSTDGGDTWEWLRGLGEYCTNGAWYQCDYDNVIRIDPNDPDIMYAGGLNQVVPKTYDWVGVVHRSTDGGQTWTDLTPAVEGSFMHTDVHALAFDPTNSNIVWVGTDGGVFRTQDVSADPPQWETLSDGLSTLLMIDVGLHPTDPNYLLAGMQDNAWAVTDDRQNWEGASISDGAYVAVDPFKPEIVYGSTFAPHLFQRNADSGHGDWTTWIRPGVTGGAYNVGLNQEDTWPFYPPFAVDPNNEGVLYIGSSRIYRSDDRALHWQPASDFLNKTQTGLVSSIAIAPGDSDTIYVGTTDGTLWLSTDGSQSWSEVTGSGFSARSVTQLAVDPGDAQTVYATFGGFNLQTPDTPGHVFATHDGGGAWDDITYNLPDAPVTTVVVDTREPYAGVYVGGGLGVWVLQKDSQQWLPYGTGMPFSLVTSLKLNPLTGVMAAATYGRSAWVMDMP